MEKLATWIYIFIFWFIWASIKNAQRSFRCQFLKEMFSTSSFLRRLQDAPFTQKTSLNWKFCAQSQFAFFTLVTWIKILFGCASCACWNLFVSQHAFKSHQQNWQRDDNSSTKSTFSRNIYIECFWQKVVSAAVARYLLMQHQILSSQTRIITRNVENQQNPIYQKRWVSTMWYKHIPISMKNKYLVADK